MPTSVSETAPGFVIPSGARSTPSGPGSQRLIETDAYKRSESDVDPSLSVSVAIPGPRGCLALSRSAERPSKANSPPPLFASAKYPKHFASCVWMVACPSAGAQTTTHAHRESV